MTTTGQAQAQERCRKAQVELAEASEALLAAITPTNAELIQTSEYLQARMHEPKQRASDWCGSGYLAVLAHQILSWRA